MGKFDNKSHLGYIKTKDENMAKTQTTIRIEENNYKKARKLLKIIGLSYSQAVNMFNSMIVLNQGLPFDVKIPNNLTLEAMEEANKLEGDYITLNDLKRTTSSTRVQRS